MNVNFADVAILSSMINFISMLGNLIWSIRLNGVKAKGEIIQYWKEESAKKDQQLKDMEKKLKEKDEIIKEMMRKKNVLKVQYANQLSTTKRLEGEVRAYKRFHEHPTVD